MPHSLPTHWSSTLCHPAISGEPTIVKNSMDMKTFKAPNQDTKNAELSHSTRPLYSGGIKPERN